MSSFANCFVGSFVGSFVDSFVNHVVSSFVSSFVNYSVSSFVDFFASSFVDSFASSFVNYFLSSFVAPTPGLLLLLACSLPLPVSTTKPSFWLSHCTRPQQPCRKTCFLNIRDHAVRIHLEHERFHWQVRHLVCVRIFEPHVVSYQFTFRGEQVDAEKIVCYIVGGDPTQYAEGAVPFDIGNRNAARKVMVRFPPATVRPIKIPVLV